MQFGCESPPQFVPLLPFLYRRENLCLNKTFWFNGVCSCCCSSICHDLLFMLLRLGWRWWNWLNSHFQTLLVQVPNHRCLVHTWFVDELFSELTFSSTFHQACCVCRDVGWSPYGTYITPVSSISQEDKFLSWEGFISCGWYDLAHTYAETVFGLFW